MMSQQDIGDGPIERQYVQTMTGIAHALDAAFNGDTTGGERETGFVLLVFPFGERQGRCNYISNGADRRDIAALLAEQLKRFEADLEPEP